MTSESEFWLRLALTPGLSPRAARRAVEAAGGPGVACRWPLERLAQAGGAARAAALTRRPIDLDLRPVLRRCEALGVAILTPDLDLWPHEAFEGLADPPAALFLSGRLPGADQPCAAIVGTRRASPYGLRVARELAESLARRGVCVVSGLAVGIDAAAHAGALRAGTAGPRTLAVLGNGTAVAYPPENALLSAEIAGQGGLLSEHPPDTSPERWHFPRRNRLVAALARVLVVVEAPLSSGAMLTAALAVQAGREVLAVPGPIDRFVHEGSHRLLREGSAALCRGPADVLEALGLATADGDPPAAAGVPLPPPGPQLTLFGLLAPDEALDADALCRASGLAADEVGAALAALELDGRVRRLPGVGYLRC